MVAVAARGCQGKPPVADHALGDRAGTFAIARGPGHPWLAVVQRIESGSLRGRKLLPLPAGVPGLRPTGARIRGAIFDRLQQAVIDARVLDLFAGSGALSFEALSRGAAECTLLDVDARVVAHLRRQIDALGVAARVRVQQADALRWLRAGRGEGASYDLVLVDPPFAMPDVFEPIAHALVDGGWLAPEAWVVCERELVRGTTGVVAWPQALRLERARDYGQARLELLRYRSSSDPP